MDLTLFKNIDIWILTYLPFLKKESVILDLTRKALDDNELTNDPCLLTLGIGLWRSETEEDFPSQLLANRKVPSGLSEVEEIILINQLIPTL